MLSNAACSCSVLQAALLAALLGAPGLAHHRSPLLPPPTLHTRSRPGPGAAVSQAAQLVAAHQSSMVVAAATMLP